MANNFEGVEEFLDQGVPQAPQTNATDRQQQQNNGTNSAAAAMGSNAKMPDVLDIMSINNRIVYQSTMSVEGKQFIENLTKEIEKNSTAVNGPARGLDIKIKPLNRPNESIVIYNGLNAFIFMFEEALATTNGVPVSAYSEQATESARALLGEDICVWNVLTVTPEDYTQMPVWAQVLVNTFISLADPSVGYFNINSFKDVKLIVNFDKRTYEEAVRVLNPHAIKDRADVTITVSWVPKNNGYNSNNEKYFRNAESDVKLLFALGLYTKFNQSEKNSISGANINANGASVPNLLYLPEVHISNISPVIPSPSIIPLAMGIAAQVGLLHGLWKKQFKILGGANTPNVGNLVANEKGDAVGKAQTEQDVERILGESCTSPALCLDIPEGRWRIPGLERYGISGNAGCKFIIDNYNSFMNANVLSYQNLQDIPSKFWYEEYAGLIINHQTNKYEDSRNLDFLHAMVFNQQNPGKCAGFLVHDPNPDAMLRLIQEFAPSFRSLYMNRVATIEPAATEALIAELRRSITIIDNYVDTNLINPAGVIESARGWGARSTFGGSTSYSSEYDRLWGGTGSIQQMRNNGWGI